MVARGVFLLELARLVVATALSSAAPPCVMLVRRDLQGREAAIVWRMHNKLKMPVTWIAVATDEGETYYWNQETQETSWEVPVAAPPNLRVSRI